MKYLFDTEDYNSPELLQQDELDRDMKFFDELENEIRISRVLYKAEMTQK
jgi:hypothetical protein